VAFGTFRKAFTADEVTLSTLENFTLSKILETNGTLEDLPKLPEGGLRLTHAEYRYFFRS
jgi:hypothetical protein